MVKKYLLIIALLLQNICSAKDYLDYHAYINKAETYLVDNKIDSCFYYYDKAFAEFDFVFVKDAFIAAQAGIKHNDARRVVQYLIKGALNGMRADCINTCVIFDAMKETALYVKVRLGMDSAYDIYSRTHDTKLANEWAQRFSLDLDAKDNGSTTEHKGIVADNAKAVKELMKIKGFPGEKILGPIDDCRDMGNYHAMISLLEYDCGVAEMHDQLWEAVKRGELHPRDFAALCEAEKDMEQHKDTRAVANPACYTKLQPRGLYFQLNDFKKNNAKTGEAEKNRVTHGICTIDTDRKKVALAEREDYKFKFGRWPM
ncbi:MAG: hypothetical protein H0X33_11020 [Taibaiella sp.]|nr:hypothetical protein [Taibaiella sp.]